MSSIYLRGKVVKWHSRLNVGIYYIDYNAQKYWNAIKFKVQPEKCVAQTLVCVTLVKHTVIGSLNNRSESRNSKVAPTSHLPVGDYRLTRYYLLRQRFTKSALDGGWRYNRGVGASLPSINVPGLLVNPVGSLQCGCQHVGFAQARFLAVDSSQLKN